jgi:hypothetical protein
MELADDTRRGSWDSSKGSLQVTAAVRNNHGKSSQGTAEMFQKVAGAELMASKSHRAHVRCKDLKRRSYEA